jgi:hypothetical protein
MRRLRLIAAGFVLAIVLVTPPAASAGGMGDLVDIIIGLTGPQMIGVPIACQVNIQSKETACYIAGSRIASRDRRLADEEFWIARRLWVSLGGGAYISTGKNSDMREFEFGRVRMLTLEPTFNVRSVENTDSTFAIEHGAGLSYFFLFGSGFKRFDNVGLKTTPVALTWRNIFETQKDFGVAYNLRIFPDPFTAQQFGADPATNTHRGREIVHGFTIIFNF